VSRDRDGISIPIRKVEIGHTVENSEKGLHKRKKNLFFFARRGGLRSEG
jgi:hypothetical protein